MTDVQTGICLTFSCVMLLFHLCAWAGRHVLEMKIDSLDKEIDRLDNKIDGLIKELKRWRKSLRLSDED